MLEIYKINRILRLRYIIFLLLMIPNYVLGEGLRSHIDDIKKLNALVPSSISKAKEFRILAEDIVDRVEEMRLLYEETKDQTPLNSRKRGNMKISYYEDNIAVYESKQSIGVEIAKNEKLTLKDKGFSYTYRGKYYYSEFSLKDKSSEKATKLKWLSVGGYEYWENESQNGFKSIDKKKRLLYKFYRIFKGDNTFYRIMLGNKSGIYFSEKSKNRTRYYTFYPDKTLRAGRDGSINYYIKHKDKLGYKIGRNGNVKLTDRFIIELYSPNVRSYQKREYVSSFVNDFGSEHIYATYLKILSAMRVNLSNSKLVMKGLMRDLRKKYRLKGLKESKKLNKLSKRHLQYILKNRPKDYHEEEEGKPGFSGRTPFERRKNAGYGNVVKEFVVWGNDYISNYIFMLSREEWLEALLDGRTVEFGYASMGPQKGGRQQTLIVLTLGILEGEQNAEEELNIQESLNKYREELSRKKRVTVNKELAEVVFEESF